MHLAGDFRIDVYGVSCGIIDISGFVGQVGSALMPQAASEP